MRKIPFAGIELTSQRVRGLRGTSELPGRPETYNTCTVTNKRRFWQVIFSTQCSADCCRKSLPRIHHYFRIEVFEITVNKNENIFHQRKAAEGDDAPRDQLGTVRLVSSISRPALDRWATRRTVSPSRFARSSSSFVQCIVLSSERKSSIPLLMQPLGEVQVENTSFQGHRLEYSGSNTLFPMWYPGGSLDMQCSRRESCSRVFTLAFTFKDPGLFV